MRSADLPHRQARAGGELIRESALRGAFENPGPLNQPPGTGAPQSSPTSEVKPVNSAPIKAELIGKPDDAQLKAAHDHLLEMVSKNAGAH